MKHVLYLDMSLFGRHSTGHRKHLIQKAVKGWLLDWMCIWPRLTGISISVQV